MANELFRLEIISPAGAVFDGDVKHVKAPGVNGSFGVLVGHTPFITALEIGKIEATLESGDEIVFSTSGGMGEIHGDKVVILAETAENKTKVDAERAKASFDRAMTRISSGDSDIDIARAREALARATNRLNIN